MIVEKKDTALVVGSGDLEVLATPVMIAVIEGEAMKQAKALCKEGETTVGTLLNVAHTRATAVGQEVWAEAKLVGQEGRKLVFEVVAFDGRGEIGRGTHERFVVDAQRFMAKL